MAIVIFLYVMSRQKIDYEMIYYGIYIGRPTYLYIIQVLCVALIIVTYRGVPRIWEGGGQEYFFWDLEICMSQSDMLRMAKPCALLGGFGGMPPEKIFINGAIWCVLVHIWIRFFTLKNFKKYHFLYNFF